MLKDIILQDNISEQTILTHLQNAKNAQKELKEALKYLEEAAYEMTMETDYEEYELQYEDETGIPAYECDNDHFQRWFEDTLLGEDLANIRRFLEELSGAKDLQARLDSEGLASTTQSPKELINAIKNYQVLKALKLLQSEEIKKKHIGKDVLAACDEALDSLIDVVVIDSDKGRETGEGIKVAFLNFIYVDFNASGYKDYSGEVRKALKKSSLYELRKILESITKGKSIESALHDCAFYDKKGKFKPKHPELSYIPLTILELKILVEIEEVNLGKIDLSYIKSLAKLFAHYSFEVFHWRTNRKDFSGIESWDTSKVADMESLFLGLKDFNANLSKWKVSSVKNFKYMFADCSSFDSDLSKWKPKKAENISSMFDGAQSFKSNLDSWDLPKEVVEKSKSVFAGCPLSENPPLWYKAVFDMSKPSVELLKALVKVRDYKAAKIILEKLQPLNKEEYNEIAKLCFYTPAGQVGGIYPDKDFFTTLVNQVKAQIGSIPAISNEVMQNCLRFDKFEYAKYLISLGYKITIDKENAFGISTKLQCKPTKDICEILHFIVENLDNKINPDFFRYLDFDDESLCYRYQRFDEETLDVFFKELLAHYPKEVFTDKKMLEFFVNTDLLYILLNNGLKADLQGVGYNADVLDRYPPKHMLLLIKHNLLNAYSVVKDTYKHESCFLFYMIYKFKTCPHDTHKKDILEILKLLIKQVRDISSLGTYNYCNFYEMIKCRGYDGEEESAKLKALFEEQGLDINPPKVSPKGLKYYPATASELKDLCDDLSVNLGDIDIGLLTSLACIFRGSKREDYSGIETWDTSNILEMDEMFYNNTIFNEDISSWDTSNVKSMRKMFCFASAFNQPLNAWNVSNVEDMGLMFQEASAFNQPLDKWKPSSLGNVEDMFLHAKSFCQNIDSWELKLEGMESYGHDSFYGSPMHSNPPKWHKAYYENAD